MRGRKHFARCRHAFRVAEKFRAAPALLHHAAAGRAQGKNHRKHHPEGRRTGRAADCPALDRTRRDATRRKRVPNKREKWQQVAIEAIKQCGAAWLPEDRGTGDSPEFLARKEKFDLSLVGSLQKERRHPRESFQEFEAKHGRLPQSVGVWIGPEGDFTPAELKAIQAAGALPISLGRLVLRVETAAIYCLSILNYELSRVRHNCIGSAGVGRNLIVGGTAGGIRLIKPISVCNTFVNPVLD